VLDNPRATQNGAVNILGLTERAVTAEFAARYGKGAYHARGVMRRLYAAGNLDGLGDAPEFRDNPALARRVIADFPTALPPVSRRVEDGETVKFALGLGGGREVEAVIIPMSGHYSLCVSTQVGCARNCAFCRTARMGFVRNLEAWEIVAQYMAARFVLGADIRNIVFMGMGEPFDNLDAVLEAVDVLTEPRGAAILPGRISLSTCGQVAGLEGLRARADAEPSKGYRLLTLAVSLHAARDDVRGAIMPVNAVWPLDRLKAALLALPHSREKDRLYFEYLVMPGVNDSPADADALKAFLGGMVAKVNLIAYRAPKDHPEGTPSESPRESAAPADMERFWTLLRERGIACYTRKGKGETIQASCGQLATESRRHG